MKVIAFHVQHDAGLAIADGGRLVLALELERLFEQRHFASAEDDAGFRAQWSRAIACATAYTGIEEHDVAVTSWVMPSRRRILQGLVRARTWRTVDHHVAHALHALHDAPFARPLVISFDGGGNDGTFRVFRGEAATGRLTPVETVPLNLGTPYRLLAITMPEVTSGRPQPRAGHLALAGKLMAYAALGEPQPAWRAALTHYYRSYQEPQQALYSLGEAIGLELEPDRLGPDEARALAASSQEVFTSLLVEIVRGHLRDGDDGVVLTGGCALNVVANQRLRRAIPVGVHVPPAPNDAGIAVGALWSVGVPAARPSPFVGLPLVADVGEATFAARGGRQRGAADIARLLARGAVIGVAAGRAELGPRALGNRSILAAPGSPDVRDRINARIKSREWYRPIAPAVRLADVDRFFAPPAVSPYMSFAADVRSDARGLVPAAVHVDGTARVQTVTDDAPLGPILSALRTLGATPCVINTSFNLRGQPLLQRASAALSALDQADLDFAWIDGWLLPRTAAVAARFAEVLA